MKQNAFLILGLVTILSIQSPIYAADAVVCVNCSNEVTQLLNKATLLQQLAQQAEQLKTEINQYSDMLQNSKGVSTQLWGKAFQDFTRLQQIMSQSKALAASASNLDGQFAGKYGTYTAYQNQQMGKEDFQRKYQQWSVEGSDNALYTLKGLNLQAQQMEEEQAVIHQLQSMAGSAEGRMQALQVANMMASQQVDQVFKLRQLMMQQVQMQANYLAIQQDKEAAERAARDKYYKIHPMNLNGGRY
jgi:P-type conjugative transfer protein TrbJ